MEKMHSIDGNEVNERWHYTTLNIHIILMECIMEFKFGMMIHHYHFNPFVYSMTPYDLDRNLQHEKISQNCRFYKYKKYYVQN